MLKSTISTAKRKAMDMLISYLGRESVLAFTLKKEEKVLIALQDKTYLKKNNFENSYLLESGWINSAVKREIIDANNKPIPWMTYPFIHFLEPRLANTMNIFEFGSGNSTLYFSARVKTIFSLEHNKQWYERMQPLLPENAKLLYENLKYGGNYSKKTKSLGQKFDVIIIDGRDRVNCCLNAGSALNENGVIVLDNSNRKSYKKGIDFLLEKGFKKLDFVGMAPKSPQLSCTSLFYRDNNCLGI